MIPVLMANTVQVARKNFMDNFSSLAVEKCLLEPTKSIFCAQTVELQTDETIHTLAAEDEKSQKERKRLEARVSALQRCLDHLHRLDRHNFRGRSSQWVVVTALADDAQCIPRQTLRDGLSDGGPESDMPALNGEASSVSDVSNGVEAMSIAGDSSQLSFNDLSMKTPQKRKKPRNLGPSLNIT